MKKLIYKNRYLLTAILCLCIGFLPVIINNKSVLIFNGDDFHQIYQFYLGGVRKLAFNNFSLYDFSIGFGTNAFAMAYYLFSPFFLMVYFLGENLIQYAFLYMNIIKIAMLFYFTMQWSKEVFKHQTSVIIGAFTVSFSGWVFSYLHLYVFLDAFIFYPLALYFIEKYIKDNRNISFVLVLGLIGLINYYFLYMFIPFICLYALFRTVEIKKNGLKDLLIEALKFSGLTLLGIGLAAFILIPCAYLLSSNPRFETDITLFSHLGKLDLFKIISGLFTMSVDHESTSILIDLNKYNFIGWGGGASLYMMSITIMLVVLIVKLKNKVRKIGLILIFGLFAIMVFFKSFWYLLQFNMESRWFYMISFMLAFSAMSVNDEIEEGLIKRKDILSALGVYLIFLWGLFLISYFFQLSTRLHIALIMITITSIFAILIALYYLYGYKKLLLLVLCLESIMSISLLVYIDKPVDYHITNLAAEDVDVVNKIKEDNGFYRIMYNDEYYDLFRYTTSNTPYANDFKGVSFYSTIYNSEMEDFLSRLKNNWQMDQRYSSWDLYNLLSVKYIYAKSEPKQIPFGYFLKETFQDYKIYENKNFVELGFSYDKTISKKSFDNLTYLNQDLVMADYLVVDGGEDVEYTGNLIDYGSMGSEDVRYYAFAKPLNNVNIYLETGTIEKVQVDMFYQDKLVYSDYFWQYNYLDFYIDENTFVDLVVVSGNNENQNHDVNIKVKEMAYYDEWFKNRFDEKLENVVYKNDYIEADITVKDHAKWIFTNIGYDKGWHVEVDNQEVQTSKVQLGFLGFKVDEGYHKITMYYKTPYLNVGMAISLISLGIYILLIFEKRKK